MAKTNEKTKTTASAETEKKAAGVETGNQASPSDIAPAPAAPETKPETATETAAPATQRRSAKTASKPVVKDVDEFIAQRNLPAWMGESVKVFAGWKSGKEVTADEFNEVIDGWNKRRQGGGKR